MIPLPNLEKARAAVRPLISEKTASKRDRFLSALEENGLTVDDVARNISTIANYTDDENLKLRANEMASKLFGIVNDENQQSTVINVIVEGNVNIAAICTPQG